MLTYDHRDEAAKQTYYTTTAIAYLNGPPHVGHAYEFVTADIISRYHRIAGRDSFYLTGSDEHGQKVANTAEKHGKAPQEFVDEMVLLFKDLNTRTCLGPHRFIRTTDQYHQDVCKWLWRRVEENGDLYLGTYEGWYNIKEETFITEREAESDGFKDRHGIPYEKRVEECFFFRMSKYHDQIYDLLKNTNFVQPESRRNELVQRLEKAPLDDLCVSRTSLKWGIPVPDHPNHVMYVWFDALSNYISGIEFNDPSSEKAKYWPANVHIIGKDIIWFHCVIWPSMLLSAKLPLPEKVFGHGFVQDASGLKMSKSLNNVVDPMQALRIVSADTFRWYLAREGHYGQDLKFSVESLVDMHNADLCANLGNLVHRAITLCVKTCDGKVPDVLPDPIVDLPLLYDKCEQAMADFALETLATNGLDICRQVNKYLTDQAPWKLKEESQLEKKSIIIRSVMEAIYIAAHFLFPVIPTAAELVCQRLGTPMRTLAELDHEKPNLTTGAHVTIGEVLFSPLEVEAFEKKAAEH